MVYFAIRFPAERVIAAFSTRPGGVSKGAYAALNLGFHVGDDPAAVRVNRQLILQALGFGVEDLVCGQQVHGNLVKVVERSERGRGANSPGDALAGVDGMVTDNAGVVLGAFFADCVPVFLADAAGRCIGLVHAGWRGTAAGIVKAAVGVMCDTYSISPASVVAVIGPAIGRCCYEVRDEVVAMVEKTGVHGVAARSAGGSWRLDLQEANRQMLVAAGVNPNLIQVMPFCTACRQDLFYSYRACNGLTGRMGAFIALR